MLADRIAKASKDNLIALATLSAAAERRNIVKSVFSSFSASKTKLLQLYEATDNSVVVKSTLAIDAVPEKFKTTTTMYYTISGVSYAKLAAAAIVFTAAHVITANKFGIILLQINAAGVVSSKVPLANQAYNTAALALAALPAADADNIAIGYIAIANNAGDWTANVDDLTNASDVTTAAFVDATETGVLRLEEYIVDSRELYFGDEGLRWLGKGTTVVAILEASGTAGTIGKITLAGEIAA